LFAVCLRDGFKTQNSSVASFAHTPKGSVGERLMERAERTPIGDLEVDMMA
jgi:hypothetical protein